MGITELSIHSIFALLEFLKSKILFGYEISFDFIKLILLRLAVLIYIHCMRLSLVNSILCKIRIHRITIQLSMTNKRQKVIIIIMFDI